jgi:zinc/manganese transport system ATP-binding protein
MGDDLLGRLAAMTAATIQLHDVTIAYDRHPAVHHVSGAFEAGHLTAIVGPNGAGKSTLVKALIGELPLADGSINRGSLAQSDFGYLPQAAEIDRRFPLAVADLVMLGAWRQIGAFGGASRATAAKARAALAAVELDGFENRPIATLSAGQFQRALFARLLLQDAPAIILDEPFTAIDSRTTARLLEIVRQWGREGRTVIAVLHDLEQVRGHFPQTLLLAREKVAWGPTDMALSTSHLGKARAMSEGWDDNAPVCEAARWRRS